MVRYWNQVRAVQELTGLPASEARGLVRELRADGIDSAPATRHQAAQEARQAAIERRRELQAERARELQAETRRALRPPSYGEPGGGGGGGGPAPVMAPRSPEWEPDYDVEADYYGFEGDEEIEY